MIMIDGLIYHAELYGLKMTGTKNTHIQFYSGQQFDLKLYHTGRTRGLRYESAVGFTML